MKQIKYRQCKLIREQGDVKYEHTSWIPEQYAVVGSTVRYKEGDGEWSEEWTVAFATGPLLEEKYAVHMSHAYTRQRKASDI